MTNKYHQSVSQPYRIQKRLALNQCFKRIAESETPPAKILYVTFGGEDIYDAMDLLGVFDVKNIQLQVVSFEQNRLVALQSRARPVFKTLSLVRTVKVQVIAKSFPNDLDHLIKLKRGRRTILFLDYTGTFRPPDAEGLFEVLRLKLLSRGDFLMITSCLSPRIVNQKSFMQDDNDSFLLYYNINQADYGFRARNHVELLVAKTLSKLDRATRYTDDHQQLAAKPLCKFKYADSRSPMGLWLFSLDDQLDSSNLQDTPFEVFPHSFAASELARDTGVNIFD